MKYEMTKPCSDCPFLKVHRVGYALERLKEFTTGEFPCHKTAEYEDLDDEGRGGGYKAVPDSQHCAGALIFLEKRNAPHQMMRICERLGFYDRTKLDMTAEVR